MNDKKGNRVRRILESKRQPPEYQRLDIEPKEGGKSLLHDEFGILKVSPSPHNKGDIPMMDEIPSEPVQIKASVPSSNVKIPTGIPKKGPPAPSVDEEDGFYPPRSNFVSVGQKEHTWYAPEVTGPPKETIDNNDDVDVESLQGMDPLEDLHNESASEIRLKFEKVLSMIEEEALALVYTATSPEDLDEIASSIFGKDSSLTSLLREFKSIPAEERRVVGELINFAVENIKLEISSKQDSFGIEEEDEEPQEEDISKDDKVYIPQPGAIGKLPALQEGNFAILIDDKLFNTAQDASSAKNILSRLILGNNVDVSRIQVIKRVPIDFGIILED